MALRHFLFVCGPFTLVLLTGCRSPTVSRPQSPSTPIGVTKGPPAKSAPLEKITPPQGTFYTAPYLQLGEDTSASGTLSLVWHTPGDTAPKPGQWIVETRSPADVGEWVKQAAQIQTNPITVGAVMPHTVCVSPMIGLKPGEPFDYRISKDGKPVFATRANRARPEADQPYRMVIFGDCAEDTAWQKKVAYQTSLLKPDAVLITGDIVYPHGRASEYRTNFFPVYGAAKADPKRGAPLLSSTLFIGVSGNHDMMYSSLAKYPDGLAYYYYWKQPLNGWGGAGSGRVPPIKGNILPFRKATGKSFPSGANYSFEYGNTHFVAIDSNFYMNWQDPKMINGLRKAITANPSATWRFVVLHVAPFHSSVSHQNEQWMRRLAPLFEETGVDVVWSGHVHNYQRSYPLRFRPSAKRSADGTVGGEFSLDTVFDGTRMTKPNGVLYVVTGAGGAALYKKPLHTGEGAAQTEPFTAKYDADIHSLTELSVNGKTLSVRQIDENGVEVDKWSVTK